MSDVLEALRTLPPDLAHPPDRYDRVRARVVRRRRRQVLLGTAAGTAVVLVAIVAITSSLEDPTAREPRFATDPNTETEQVVAPGGTRVGELRAPVVSNVTGTVTISLGERPATANAVVISIWCLSGGTLQLPSPLGGSMACSPKDAAEVDDRATSGGNIVKLAPGVDSLRFKASPGSAWQVETIYVRAEQVPWAVNANGDTYGVANEDGQPDLVSVYATNGRTGYAFTTELDGPEPTSPADGLAQQEANEGKSRTIPVYESDGETQIGEFVIGPGWTEPPSGHAANR